MPSSATTSSVSGVPVASGRHQGKRKRSRGSTSLATGRDIPQSPHVHGTSNVRPLPTGRGQGSRKRKASNVRPLPTGRGQGSRKRKASSSRNYKGPNSSSETDGRDDTGVAEDDLTPAERAIPGTQLLTNLGKHPSVYARAGKNPKTKGLSFRGAWKRAVTLYRAANNQYKQLFVAAGFGDFLRIEPVDLPQGYIIALTERWFSKTNTIHLPCCELGPTPVDWTMITGLRFGGRCIKVDPNDKVDKENVWELLGVGGIDEQIFKGNNIKLSEIKPKMSEVRTVPPTREAKERIFRRLFLYVIGGCFFGNGQSVIHPGLVKFLEDVEAVRTYNWGAITYATFLSGMRRKVDGQIGSFRAFWQFLAFWAFEYLNIYRPELADENAFPRAMRWRFPRNHGTLDNSELTASRFQLDYVDDESQVTWEPYLHRLGGIVYSLALSERRVKFMGLDTWEYYLGERCRRQLGLPCLVPSDPPKIMHKVKGKRINIGESAETFVRRDIVDYATWFAKNSIGKIVGVTQLIGGREIGRKVIGDWVARHRPGMILVPESEVKERKEALDTAKAEREKLREELYQVRRGSDF